MPTRHIRNTLTACVAIAAATALVLGGCSTSSSPSTSPGSSPGESGTSSATPVRTGKQADEDDTAMGSGASLAEKRRARGNDAGLLVTDIRIGRHDGFDRVVYELAGTGEPGWTTLYVEEARQEGSGFPKRVEGDSILEIRVLGTLLPFDAEAPETGEFDRDVRGVDGGGVTEVIWSNNFEGETQTFIGLRGKRRPFSVFTLTNPTRVVIDIAR